MSGLEWSVADLQEALETSLCPALPALGRIAAWTALLAKWNRVQRLVGFRSKEDLMVEGIADALAAAPLLEGAPDGPVLDLGSGNGLPAVLWAALFPERDIHLVESRRKRCAFLRASARELGLPCLHIHEGRADELAGRGALPRPALLSARAFAPPIEVLRIAGAWGSRAVLLSLTPQTDLKAESGWELSGEARGRPRNRRVHRLFVPTLDC